MALPTHQLGRTGLQITRIGFGSRAVGGGGRAYGWGPQDDAESLATMRRALELGVTWIDTAAVHGLTRRDLDDVAAAIRQTGAGVRPAQQAAASPAIQEVAQ